jgi:hypothetical protein
MAPGGNPEFGTRDATVKTGDQSHRCRDLNATKRQAVPETMNRFQRRSHSISIRMSDDHWAKPSMVRTQESAAMRLFDKEENGERSFTASKKKTDQITFRILAL